MVLDLDTSVYNIYIKYKLSDYDAMCMYPLSSQRSGVTGRYGGNTIPEGSDVGKSPSIVPPVRVNPRIKCSYQIGVYRYGVQLHLMPP
jgi:hypothetical protein